MRTRKLLRHRGTRQAVKNQHLKDWLDKRRSEGRSSLSRTDVAGIVAKDNLEKLRRLDVARKAREAALHGSPPAEPEGGGSSLPSAPAAGGLP